MKNKDIIFSKSLNKDIRKMEENRFNFIDKKMDVDEYIKFLNFYNEFIGHKMRKFEKIKGNNWKI